MPTAKPEMPAASAPKMESPGWASATFTVLRTMARAIQNATSEASATARRECAGKPDEYPGDRAAGRQRKDDVVWRRKRHFAFLTGIVSR